MVFHYWHRNCCGLLSGLDKRPQCWLNCDQTQSTNYFWQKAKYFLFRWQLKLIMGFFFTHTKVNRTGCLLQTFCLWLSNQYLNSKLVKNSFKFLITYLVILYVWGESSTAVSISEYTQNFSAKNWSIQFSPLLYSDWMISPSFIFL